MGKATGMRFLISAAAALALLSGCSSGSDQPDGGQVCDAGWCPAGTQCTSSDCVPLCDASGTCPPGMYCENPNAPLNVCSPISGGYVPGVTDFTGCLADTDCPLGQTCAPGGICSSLEPLQNGGSGGCSVSFFPDGCSPDALCYQISSVSSQPEYYCVGLAHCAADGGCPNLSSGYGSVCNQLADGGFLFPGKERICLEDFCADNSTSPPGFGCFHQSSAGVGACQEGLPGEPCRVPADCFNSPNGCGIPLSDGGEAQDDGGSVGKCY